MIFTFNPSHKPSHPSRTLTPALAVGQVDVRTSMVDLIYISVWLLFKSAKTAANQMVTTKLWQNSTLTRDNRDPKVSHPIPQPPSLTALGLIPSPSLPWRFGLFEGGRIVVNPFMGSSAHCFVLIPGMGASSERRARFTIYRADHLCAQ